MLPILLALQILPLGGGLSGLLDWPGDAQPPRTDEEGGADAAHARSTAANWFKAKGEISSGAVEGLNNKIRVVTRRSYGFRTYRSYGNSPISQFRPASGTGIYPQILLTRQTYL